MIRFGMHASLWAQSWTREGAELAITEAARYGLDLIEIPLLEPDKVDVAHSRLLFERHGVACTASLGLPLEVEASQFPAEATAFLNRTLDVAHGLGCSTLTGVIYSALGYRSGSPPTEAEYENIVKALQPVARRAPRSRHDARASRPATATKPIWSTPPSRRACCWSGSASPT